VDEARYIKGRAKRNGGAGDRTLSAEVQARAACQLRIRVSPYLPVWRNRRVGETSGRVDLGPPPKDRQDGIARRQEGSQAGCWEGIECRNSIS